MRIWDHGVIATFKAYYLRKTFVQVVGKIFRENTINITEFWKDCNIKNSEEHVEMLKTKEFTSKELDSIFRLF